MPVDTDAADAPGTDAEDLWIEAWPDCRAANQQNVCLTAYLDHPRPPGIDCRQIIDHDGHARVSLHVAVFLALRKAVAADIDGVLVRVIAKRHGHDVRLAARPTRRYAGEPLTLQVGDLSRREDAHRSSPWCERLCSTAN